MEGTSLKSTLSEPSGISWMGQRSLPPTAEAMKKNLSHKPKTSQIPKFTGPEP